MRLVGALLAVLMAVVPGARAADGPASAAPPRGWVDTALVQIEAEIVSDAGTVPAIPDALVREWRSLDKNGSSSAAVVDVVWIVLAALAALIFEKATARILIRKTRWHLGAGNARLGLGDFVRLLASDLAGLAVFMVVFAFARRLLQMDTDASGALLTLATAVLIRWRTVSLVIGAILRPRVPGARLVEVNDQEAARLWRFLSVAILFDVILVAFGRYGLTDEDNGAAHVIGLIFALIICGLYAVIIVRSRRAAENLIRGRSATGPIPALRNALARAWLAVALSLLAALLVFFVAGLSLGLLPFYRAVSSTLALLFLVLVFERFSDRVWGGDIGDIDGVPPRSGSVTHRATVAIWHAGGVATATLILAWIWVGAFSGEADAWATNAMALARSAIATLFLAYVAWELIRLAIDRHLQASSGPAQPGTADDDEEISPASRLQTVLPLVRAAFAVVIGVLAALIVLSRLGVDTAPLIAGAGVFGLAVSFGSQSLVRDIISGLFYMWDDAFRVGEYIDTGRLKGTVETLGIRSVKLRHQNGPLHTIPYGQLGAVTNLSRDFATIKFNLRFAPETDIELVRRTTKQLGLAMQQDHPELAAEMMQPLKLQGIAEIIDTAVVLRFKFTARPIKPSWVQREYLKRMVKAFAEKGIQFASGATMILQVNPTAEQPPDQSAGLSAPTAVAAAIGSTAVVSALEAAATD